MTRKVLCEIVKNAGKEKVKFLQEACVRDTQKQKGALTKVRGAVPGVVIRWLRGLTASNAAVVWLSRPLKPTLRNAFPLLI